VANVVVFDVIIDVGHELLSTHQLRVYIRIAGNFSEARRYEKFLYFLLVVSILLIANNLKGKGSSLDIAPLTIGYWIAALHNLGSGS